MEEKIRELLAGIVHPETGRDLASGGMIDSISADGERIV